MKTIDELFEAKKRLYYLLLSLDYEKLTPQETNILFELSKDHQIRAFLRTALNKSL